MAHIFVATIATADIVMACIPMAYIVMAYIVMDEEEREGGHTVLRTRIWPIW